MDCGGKRPFNIHHNGKRPCANAGLHNGDDCAVGVNQVNGVVKPVQEGNGRWFFEPLLYTRRDLDCGCLPNFIHVDIVAQ